jgi:hypothetical protein
MQERATLLDALSEQISAVDDALANDLTRVRRAAVMNALPKAIGELQSGGAVPMSLRSSASVKEVSDALRSHYSATSDALSIKKVELARNYATAIRTARHDATLAPPPSFREVGLHPHLSGSHSDPLLDLAHPAQAARRATVSESHSTGARSASSGPKHSVPAAGPVAPPGRQHAAFAATPAAPRTQSAARRWGHGSSRIAAAEAAMSAQAATPISAAAKQAAFKAERERYARLVSEQRDKASLAAAVHAARKDPQEDDDKQVGDYVDRLLRAKPWLSPIAARLRRLRLASLERDYDPTLPPTVPGPAELEPVQQALQARHLPRETKPLTALRDEHRYLGLRRSADVLLQRVSAQPPAERIGLEPGASLDQRSIRKAFRTAALTWHPDNSMRRGTLFAHQAAHNEVLASVYCLIDDAYRALLEQMSSD